MTGGWSQLKESREERSFAPSDFPPYPKWAETKGKERTHFVVLSDHTDKTREEVLEEIGIDVGEDRYLPAFDMFRSYNLAPRYFNEEEAEIFRYAKKTAHRPGDTIDPRYEEQHEEDFYEREEKRRKDYVNKNGSERGFKSWGYRPPSPRNMRLSGLFYIFNVTAYEAVRRAEAGEELSRLQEAYLDLLTKGDAAEKYIDEEGNFNALFRYDAHVDFLDVLKEYVDDAEASGDLDSHGEPSVIKYLWTAKKKGDASSGPPSYDFEVDDETPVKELPEYIRKAIEQAMQAYPMKPISDLVEEMRYDPGNTPDPETGVAPNHSVKAMADAEKAKKEGSTEDSTDEGTEGAEAEAEPVAAGGGSDRKW